jgi:hypothetical protein
MSERFNSLPGMSCVPADGAMYLLPKIDIPEKAIKEAEKRGKKPDVMWTLDLLGMSFIYLWPNVFCLWVDVKLVVRCYGNLCGGGIWFRAGGRYLPCSSDGTLPWSRGLCEQDRRLPQGLHEQVGLGKGGAGSSWR